VWGGDRDGLGMGSGVVERFIERYVQSEIWRGIVICGIDACITTSWAWEGQRR
jgi:hypothetical protein